MSIEKQLESIINKKVGEFISNSFNDRLLNKVGKAARDQVVKRTRLGKGVKKPGGGPARKLKSLQEITVIYRGEYKENLSPLTRPRKSNLTATGQLLDSISYKIIKRGQKKSLRLYFKENRRFELDGTPAKISHKRINKQVEKNGRSFFYLAGFELKKLSSIIFDALNKR
jgi:hypothetical protein